MSKNELYRTEHPNEQLKEPEPPKEEPKKEEFPVYHFPEDKTDKTEKIAEAETKKPDEKK